VNRPDGEAVRLIDIQVPDRATGILDQLPVEMSGRERAIGVMSLATFRRKKPFSDDRATNLGARTRRQVGADKL